MKKLFIIYSLFLSLLSCNSESANDCIKTSGSIVKREILNIQPFDKIKVEQGIELILIQGSEQKIEVEVGENLFNEISIEVKDYELILKNNISCNWFRDYNPAKVYVTFTDITRIYSSSPYKIHSHQTLSLETLELSSGIAQEGVAAEFVLDIVCNQLNVNANDATYLNLSGNVNYMFVGFWGGEPRLEAENLKVNHIEFFQRSSNDMILYPVEKLEGNIYSTGNVIIKNTPVLIDVTQHYTGELIIQ